MKEEKEKEQVHVCVHQGCYQVATWIGTSTKESIDKIDDEYMNKIKGRFSVGTWYYCDKHKDEIGSYSPHLEFEPLK